MSKSIGRRDSSSSLSEQSGSLDDCSDENIKDTKGKRNNAQTSTKKKTEQAVKPKLKQVEKKSKSTDVKKNPGLNLKILFTEGLKIGPLSPRQTGKSTKQVQDSGTERVTTAREKVTFTDILKKSPDHPVSTPQELARITISAESNEGKIHLTKSNAETMFRSGSPTYQGKPLGASYRNPFLRSCFLKPNFITIFEEMQENYIATKKTGNLESESLRKKAESVWHASENKLDSVFSHKSVMADFSGLTKPLADKINGPASNISTSILPVRFLHFLLELDREIVRWHQQTPDGPEKLSDIELRDVRRNALSNYLGIYGPYSTIMLAAQEVKSEKQIYDKENPYVLLENVLTKKIWEKYDEFLSSAMDCTDDQYSKIRERSNQEQERITKDIEARKMGLVNQGASHFSQSKPSDNAHSNSSTTTTTTTNTTYTTTTTAVTTTTTTATKKAERVTSDPVRKPKNDPRRSPARLAAAAVNAVKESKKNKSGGDILSAPLKPSITSLQQVFRENVTVDGHEVFKEFIVPYIGSNLKTPKAVSLGRSMYAEFSGILEEYNLLKDQALDEKKKSENLVRSAAEKRLNGLTEEANSAVMDSQNFSASAKILEEKAQAMLMPIVNPVLDYFSPKNLQNILPEQLLDFLALCDKELTDWMRAESVGMTADEMREIRIRGITGLLMNRGVGPLLQDEFSTSKNSALSEQENRKISAEFQRKYVPVQVALQRGFNLAAKTDMNEFLGFLENRTQQAIIRSKDIEKDYKVARMQAGDDGQIPSSPRKRVKASQILKDKNSAVSALKGSVDAFLVGHGLNSNLRLFKELAEFLVTEFNEQKITDPSDVELAQLTKLYIEDLRESGNMTQQRFTALEALEKSIRPLLPKAGFANQTEQNPVTMELATPSPSVTTTAALRETNQAYVSAYFDFYNLIGIDPDSYQMILQRVDDEFTENSVVATLDDVTKIGLEVLEGNMVQLSQAGDPRVQQLEAIIAELKQFS